MAFYATNKNRLNITSSTFANKKLLPSFLLVEIIQQFIKAFQFLIRLS